MAKMLQCETGEPDSIDATILAASKCIINLTEDDFCRGELQKADLAPHLIVAINRILPRPTAAIAGIALARLLQDNSVRLSFRSAGGVAMVMTMIEVCAKSKFQLSKQLLHIGSAACWIISSASNLGNF
jgi:hypothetical protein